MVETLSPMNLVVEEFACVLGASPNPVLSFTNIRARYGAVGWEF